MEKKKENEERCGEVTKNHDNDGSRQVLPRCMKMSNNDDECG